MNYNEAKNYIFNEIGDEGYTLLDYIANDKMNESINLIVKLTNCELNDAKIIWVDLKNEYGTPEKNAFLEKTDLTPQKIAQANAAAQDWLNKPKCPTCGSLNVKKISAVSKVAGASMFGLFSKTARSQFCCRNCGYKW